MFCGNCGTKINEDTKSCQNCGWSSDLAKKSRTKYFGASLKKSPQSKQMKRASRLNIKAKDIISIILAIILVNIILFLVNNPPSWAKDPLKNTSWKSDKDSLGSFYIIKFDDDKGYKIGIDWSSSNWREKVGTDINLREQGTYKVSDENRVTLKPAVYSIGGNNEAIYSIIGANTLLIEENTLTVIDSKDYKSFSKQEW